jgi:hypothetical protein
MGSNLQVVAAGVQDSTGVPAASKISANQRVKTAAGPVSIATDTLTFPGPSTVGNWIVPNQSVLIGNIPSISQNSSGQAIRAVPPPPTPGPMVIATADTRASGT